MVVKLNWIKIGSVRKNKNFLIEKEVQNKLYMKIISYSLFLSLIQRKLTYINLN